MAVGPTPSWLIAAATTTLACWFSEPSHGKESPSQQTTAHLPTRVQIHWPSTPDASAVKLLLSAQPFAKPGTDRIATGVHAIQLAWNATTYLLADVAPNALIFARVEILRHSAPPVVHDYTLRAPPRSHGFANGLLAAYGFDTRTIQLVFAERARYSRKRQTLLGLLGDGWKRGTWSVERTDGRQTKVLAVFRHSVPRGQPDYPVGLGPSDSPQLIDIEHRIFLHLDRPLGTQDFLRIRHDGAAEQQLDLWLPFSDRFTETPIVQLNQVGYSPHARARWAYISGWMGDGGPVPLTRLPDTVDVLAMTKPSAAERPSVATLKADIRSKFDSHAGAPVRQIDLSSLTTSEQRWYRIRIPGVGVSWPTRVANASLVEAFYVVARGLFHNRWCGNLDSRYTQWSRPADHCRAYYASGRDYRRGFFPRNQPQERSFELRGGHHDAGDFDIRPFHVLVGQYLLRAYELEPSLFPDRQLRIPESGNEISDLLDEALWSLDAWISMQRPDGAVAAGVESIRHPHGIYLAHNDPLPYFTFDPTPWHTAYVAALFAQAARLLGPHFSARSAQLRERAQRAYRWAKENRAPPAYLLYAASELARLTASPAFFADFATYWSKLDRYGNGAFDNLITARRVYPGSFRYSKSAMPDFMMAYAQSPGARPDLVKLIHKRLHEIATSRSQEILESSYAHRHGLGRLPIDWGGLMSTGRHVDGIYQSLQLSPSRPQHLVDAISIAADYALGANPSGRSFVSGLGHRPPLQPLHLDSLAMAKTRGLPPIPGLPVYGPVKELPRQAYYEPVRQAFFPAFSKHPPALRFADAMSSVNTSEFTVWEMQAPLTLLLAARLLRPTAVSQNPKQAKP